MRIQDPSTKWLAGIAVVVLALMVLSVAVALLNREGEVTLFAEDTPEGSVQRYLLAIEEGDLRTAYQYVGTELQADCTYSHFQDSSRWFEVGNVRVTLQGTKPLDGEAEVEVLITRFYVDPPFSSGESSQPVRYSLEQDGTVWRFVEPPYPMEWCPGRDRPAPLPPSPAIPGLGESGSLLWK